jgi:hypothetical protein
MLHLKGIKTSIKKKGMKNIELFHNHGGFFFFCSLLKQKNLEINQLQLKLVLIDFVPNTVSKYRQSLSLHLL